MEKNYLDSPEVFRREVLKTYKVIFAGSIKESFLVEMINNIEIDPRYISMSFNNANSSLSLNSLVVGRGFSGIDVCKMIVMNHYANTVFMTDSERGKQQESREYKRRLLNDVINMYKIEKLAAHDFSGSSLESYLPLIYDISATVNYLGDKYDEYLNSKKSANKPYNTEFNLRMIYKFLMKVKACINLSEIRATDELMVIYRSLIELFMTYVALWDENAQTIVSYYDFDQAAFDYNYSGAIPHQYKMMAKDFCANEIKFLNYGWIKNLKDFDCLTNKSRSFNISGLGKILDKKYDYYSKDFGSGLCKFYKACNPQTHGTLLTMNYFQLELHIFQNIAVMIKFICGIFSEALFKFDFVYEGIDLVDRLTTSLAESRKVYDWLNEDQKNLDKTNQDYRNRAICSARMR